IPGLIESNKVINSTEAMDQTEMPKKLTIIGSGYIGLEFASMFANYGTKVTVLDNHRDFLPREDNDISEMIKQDLENTGIKFELGVKINRVEDDTVFYEKDGQNLSIKSDRILAATGRKPNTQNLGLENTNIELTDNGAIKVNDHLMTTAQNVWAIGDVKGGPQFTYISLDD
ncbi:FAD-dependent oxidoreductase, partial [Lactobacillus acidophilus]